MNNFGINFTSLSDVSQFAKTMFGSDFIFVLDEIGVM